jgi:hypothetical protein
MHHTVFATSGAMQVARMQLPLGLCRPPKYNNSIWALMQRRFFSRDFPGMAAFLVFKILTLSYSGILKYHTTDPIKLMESNCDFKHQRDDMMHSLSQFRQVKQEELRVVNNAVRKTLRANQDIE